MYYSLLLLMKRFLIRDMPKVKDTPLFRPLMIGISGACIYLVVMYMALRMCSLANRKMRMVCHHQ